MRSRDTSLEELEKVQITLTHTLINLRVKEQLPTMVGLLMNIGRYVTSHIHRLREWGGRPDIDDLDLIGYSTRCIFEANLMLQYYGYHRAGPMFDLMSGEVDRDDFDILESVIAFHASPTPETQQLFDDYERRKASKHPRTPNFSDLSTRTGAEDEYKSFYKLYSKYAHPSAYQLFGDHRHVQSSFVRDIFLDRAVGYAQHCATVMEIFLQKTIELSQPDGC